MKALLISGIYPPDIGGPATYIPKLENYLLKQKWSVRVVSLIDGNKIISTFQNGRFIGRQILLPIRFIATVLTLITEMKNTDSVFANGLHQEAAIASLFYKRNKVAKIVGDPVWERYRNQSSSRIEMQNIYDVEKSNPSIRLQRLFLVWALNQFDLIVCPSTNLCEMIRKWGVQTPTIFVPNGIEIEEVTSKEYKYDIAIISRLVKWKNIDLVLEKCRKLNLRIVIAGDGPERDNLQRMSEESNSKITFMGQIPSEQVKEILCESKIFVSLSSYEGMSFSVLQAMSLGSLVVVSDIQANTELVKDKMDGIVIKKEDEANLDKIIQDAVVHHEKYSHLGVAAAAKIRNDYSIDINLCSIETLLVSFNTI